MKPGWEVKALKALCENYRDDIVDGPFGANLKREHYVTSGVPVLKIQNIKPFQIVDKKMDYVTIEKARELSRHSFRQGDIIVTKLGTPLGVSAKVVSEQEGIIVADLVRVRAKKIDTDFLCYQLNSPQASEALNAQSGGATRPRVRIAALRELPLNVPPLDEQKRIVAVLDAAFEGLTRARAHAEANLQNARELFESVLGELVRNDLNKFGSVTVSELAIKVTDGDHMPPPKSETGIPFITISNIRKDTRRIDFSSTFMVPKIYFDALKDKRRPQKGDVLYTVTGATLGIPVLVEDDRKFCFQRHIGLIRPAANTHSAWLFFMLMSDHAFQQATDGSSGAAQKTVSLRTLRAIRLPKTPREVQSNRARVLSTAWKKTSEAASNYQSKLNDLDDLRQSLLQKAFAGELT